MQSSLYQSYKTIENNKENQMMIFEGREVEIIEINGKPMFELYSTGMALGYVTTSKGKTYPHKTRIDNTVNNAEISTVVQGVQQYLTEEQLYDFMLEARTEKCKTFRKWVTDEVLPQIRKTGGYIPTNEEDDDATIMAKALMVAQKTINKKDELLKAKTRELEDKNRFINQIASSQNTLLVREVAKVISSKEGGIVIGERKLYQKLRDWGLIFKNKNEPKQQYIKQGLFEVVEGIRNTQTGTFTYQTMKVTGKGQEYILNRLLKEKKEIA